MKRVLLFFIICSSLLYANNEDIQKRVDKLEKPLYTPFVENYILNEIKLLRDENRNLKIELHKTLAKKEVEISNYVVNYATSTINNIFYIIAAASSLLVIVGWSSMRDINEKVKNMIDEKSSKIINKYEERLAVFEQDLAQRAKQVKANEKRINEMDAIHSLWLRASQDSTPTGKVETYDEILDINPNDVEALAYKADAVLDLGEANWSLNLTNQALLIDEEYANAYYQRAKAYAVLGYEDNVISDLEKAISLNDEYAMEIENDEEFDSLQSNEKLQELLALKKHV